MSVLKAEVARYAECGRRVGGLGSIQTTLDGRRYVGVSTEWREADSPKNQSIVTNPDQMLIESYNATALVRLYESLTTDEERARHVAALLRRLSKDTEYAPVGYMILYVMHRIGEALEKAELFGPVAAIIPAKDEEDAIRIANDTVFGLGASVFTRNSERGETIALDRLEAGCCFVNNFVRSDPRLPFGGIKQYRLWVRVGRVWYQGVCEHQDHLCKSQS